VAYIIYFFTLLKGTDDTQPFLGYILSTKLSFHIIFSSASHAHPSQKGLWWTEGRSSGVSIIMRVANDMQNVLVHEGFSGTGNLRSGAA